MEMVERYIFAVTKKLPEKQRSDIEQELRSLIEDMLSAQANNETPTIGDIEAVLRELGDPAQLADRYRAKKSYLIGPENYDTYIFVLKIVLAAVTFGITLAMTISYFVEPPKSIIELFVDYFSGIFGALLQVLAWVTVIFAIIESRSLPLSREFKDEQWSLADLPELPDRNLVIRLSEPIIGLLFAVIAVIIFNTAEHLIAIYSFYADETLIVIPLFNHEGFRSLLPLVNFMLALGIVKESLKLVIRKWTKGLAVINLVLNAFSFGLFVLFIRGEGLWNDAFFAFWVEAGLITADADPLLLWGKVITGLIAVVALGFLIDSAVNLYKSFRYQVK
jgi:hypothetical protein